MKLHEKIIGISSILLIAFAVTIAVFQHSDIGLLRATRADAYTVSLTQSNSPSLSNGDGTIIDERGITWEYHNASDYSGGHITLNSDGYFGVSSSTAYGFTGITRVVTSFSGSNLWLLKSVDGINWHEVETLTSGQETYSANNWRYIRFYNYSSTVNINSVTVNYSCAGISATEDVDSAFVSNVVSYSECLTASRETTDISPNSIGGEAVRFTKNGSGSTEIIMGLDRSYTIGESAYKKIEFDFNTPNINYGKTLQILNTDGTYSSSTINSNNHSAYHCTSLGNNWYHIEVPIPAFASLMSGYYTDAEHKKTQDKPTKGLANKEFNAIKINAGNCIIDNLRVGSTPTALGIYNNGTSFSSGSLYWFKIAWTGVLNSCTMTFDPSGIAEQISITDPILITEGFPFYIRGLSSGIVAVTATLDVGYNHQIKTISNTLTIS